MKNGVALVVAMVLAVLGFAAMYAVLNRKSAQRGEEGEKSPKKRVAVARKDLAAGTKLAASHLETRLIPMEFVSSAYADESQMTTLIGLTLRYPVKEGEPILLPALDSGRITGAREIESQLKSHDRLAVSIALGDAQSLAGLIEPGQKVDLIATFDIELKWIGEAKSEDKKDKDKITRTFLLLQNRTVLAVDVVTNSRYQGDPKQVTNHIVTLAVTAEEALKVALAQARGEAHLALRAAVDDRIERLPPLGVEGLLDMKGGR